MHPFIEKLCTQPLYYSTESVRTDIIIGGKTENPPPGNGLNPPEVRLEVGIKQQLRGDDFHARNRLVAEEGALGNEPGRARGIGDGVFAVTLDDADVFRLADFAAEKQVALLQVEVNRLPQAVALEGASIEPRCDKQVVFADKRRAVDVAGQVV